MHPTRLPRVLARGLAAACAAAALVLAGCSAPTPVAAAGEAGSPTGGERLRVTASFYPLQFVAERVGGERVAVTGLTEPGAEPHDLELTPQDVAGLSRAALVVYLSGFQPAVDEAVAQAGAGAAFDAAPAADLDLAAPEGEDGHGPDPHFWLDPTRLAGVADALAARLGEADPGGGQAYRAGAARLRGELERLDAQLRAGLASCADRDLVTSHTAFGYLARRYGLRQVGITGLTPEGEPSPADLAAVTRFVRDNDVRTVYSETLVSPAVARTLAAETGARTAVLDPLEGLTASSAGEDYLAVMRANLATLRKGQPCP